MIQAVIFDFDGVIADTEKLHYEAYQAVLAPKGLGFSYEEYSRCYMAFDSLGCFRQRVADLTHSADEREIRSWVEEKNDAYEALLSGKNVPSLPGALDAIALAASLGPVAVCTGAVLRDIDPMLNAFDIRKYLSAIVTADDVAISKPDPESYALACSRLHKAPASCLAIEDTPGGLQSARGAGCQTIGVTTTHTADQLRPYADRILSTLVGISFSGTQLQTS